MQKSVSSIVLLQLYSTKISPNLMSSVVKLHPLTNNPTSAWNDIMKKEIVIRLNIKTPSISSKYNMLRFVCMSDTHSLTSHIQFDIPDGDVFIHAGDFTRCGNKAEVEEFNSWIGSLPHKYKVVIAGNHELSFDTRFTGQGAQQQAHRTAHTGDSLIYEIPSLGMEREELRKAVSYTDAVSLITNAKYLQDEAITICGVKIYGTPWQPEFCNWAFNLPRGQPCLNKWNMIPENTDILLSHTPPIGHGDLCCMGVRAGCVELLSTVQERVKPKYHVFGHIHEGYGITTDGETIFINASTCNINYVPVNPPIIFDCPLPPGFTKE